MLKEGLSHIEQQFEGRTEFELNIVDILAEDRDVLEMKIWNNMVSICRKAWEAGDEVIVICNEKQIFTSHYSPNFFLHVILEAANRGAKLLLGGTGNFQQAIPISEACFWIDTFTFAPFIVLFQPIIKEISNEPFSEEDSSVEQKISEMTSHKMLIYPYISTMHVSTEMKNDSGSLILPIASEAFTISEARLCKLAHMKRLYSANLPFNL